MNKQIVINGDKGEYIIIELRRFNEEGEEELCNYQIKIEEEGLIIDAVNAKGEIYPIDAFDHEWEYSHV